MAKVDVTCACIYKYILEYWLEKCIKIQKIICSSCTVWSPEQILNSKYRRSQKLIIKNNNIRAIQRQTRIELSHILSPFHFPFYPDLDNLDEFACFNVILSISVYQCEQISHYIQWLERPKPRDFLSTRPRLLQRWHPNPWTLKSDKSQIVNLREEGNMISVGFSSSGLTDLSMNLHLSTVLTKDITSSLLKVSIPQSVWWITTISLVPRSCWLIITERRASDARPPALRITYHKVRFSSIKMENVRVHRPLASRVLPQDQSLRPYKQSQQPSWQVEAPNLPSRRKLHISH